MTLKEIVTAGYFKFAEVKIDIFTLTMKTFLQYKGKILHKILSHKKCQWVKISKV